jgi:hypothetical protein
MAQYVDTAVIATHLEVSMIRSQPTIQLLGNLDAPRPNMEAQRGLLTSIPGVTLDLNFHDIWNPSIRNASNGRSQLCSVFLT